MIEEMLGLLLPGNMPSVIANAVDLAWSAITRQANCFDSSNPS